MTCTMIDKTGKGGHISAPYFWWARAWRWTDYGYGGNYLWVFTRLFVGPGAYDRAMKFATQESDPEACGNCEAEQAEYGRPCWNHDPARIRETDS